MELEEIQDSQGRSMPVSEFMLKEAKRFGWTSDVADNSLAVALERARNYKDKTTGLPGWNESLCACAESAAIIDFCHGGPGYNPAMQPASAIGECPDYHEFMLAFRELHKRMQLLQGEVHWLEAQLKVLVDKLTLRANVEAMGGQHQPPRAGCSWVAAGIGVGIDSR